MRPIIYLDSRFGFTGRVVFLAGAILCLCPHAATARTISLSDYLKSSGGEREAYRLYMRGVEVGLNWYGATLSVQHRTPLYCPPENRPLSIEELETSLDAHLRAHKAELPKDGDLAMYIMATLIERFPCKRSPVQR